MATTRWNNRKDMAASLAPGKLCAEVGVLRGSYSREILASAPECLYLIDIWEHQDNEYKNDPANAEDLELLYKQVSIAFDLPNVRIIRDWSVATAATFPDGFFDWVYIDANHTWPAITDDVYVWWPKVKCGGWLSGHDYRNPIPHPCLQVGPVVDAWAILKQAEVFTTSDVSEGCSWAIQTT